MGHMDRIGIVHSNNILAEVALSWNILKNVDFSKNSGSGVRFSPAISEKRLFT